MPRRSLQTYREIIAGNVAAIRAIRHRTMTAVASDAKLSRRSLWVLENPEAGVDVRLSTLIEVANALDVTVGALTTPGGWALAVPRFDDDATDATEEEARDA